MGGAERHVGYAPAINTLAYMIALLVTGPRFGHLRVRRTTLSAATVALLATAAMSFCVLWAEFHAGAGGLLWIWMLIVAGGVGGAAMALYWPFLMSWVSADYEGVRLNRRFGRYNGAWSGGATIGPLIGGWLFEVNAVLPLLAAVVFVLLSLLLLSFGRDGSDREAGSLGGAGRVPSSEVPRPRPSCMTCVCWPIAAGCPAWPCSACARRMPSFARSLPWSSGTWDTRNPSLACT